MKWMLILAVFALRVLPLSAEDAPKKRDLKDRVDIEGRLVCIGCTLEKEDGADAQCTLHSKHAQGLLLSDGTLWTLVDNARGHIVITNSKLRDKDVKLLGWKFPKAQYIEVWKYQVKEGDKWVGYDYCRNCGFEVGDHHDKDVCEDCEKE